MDTFDPGTTGDKLEIGAIAIANNIFQGKVSARAIYRMAEQGGWPIFHLQGKLAAWHRPMRAEMDRRATSGAAQPEAA